MKKFLGNLWVMVTSLILFVFTSVVLVTVIVRPVCNVGDYYSKIQYDGPEGDIFVDEQWLNANADNTMSLRQVVKNTTTGEQKEQTTEYWYYLDGKTIFVIGETKNMTKEQYKEAVKKIKNMTDAEYDAYKKEEGYIHTFKAMYLSNDSSLRQGEYSKYVHKIYKNSVKIPLFSILCTVETLLLGFATVTVIFFIKNRKNKIVKIEETTNEPTQVE